MCNHPPADKSPNVMAVPYDVPSEVPDSSSYYASLWRMHMPLMLCLTLAACRASGMDPFRRDS